MYVCFPTMAPCDQSVLNFIIAWRSNVWLVLLGTAQLGERRPFEDAAAMVRRTCAEVGEGKDCQVLVHDEDGRWHELSGPPGAAEGPPRTWET